MEFLLTLLQSQQLEDDTANFTFVFGGPNSLWDLNWTPAEMESVQASFTVRRLSGAFQVSLDLILYLTH